VLGSKFAIPKPPPAGYVIVGDTASLPAINSLLEAIGDAPAQVFLEAGYGDDKDLPVARDTGITRVDRTDHGAALVQTVKSAAFEAGDHFGWVACDNRTTRSVTKVLQNDFRILRKSIAARGYWMEGRPLSLAGKSCATRIRLLDRYHDRDDELLDHRLLVGRVAARKDQQRRDHAYQPATPAFDDRRVVGAERVDECGRQGGDQLGLLGHLTADRRLRGSEPRSQRGAFADQAKRGGDACDQSFAWVVDAADLVVDRIGKPMGLAMDVRGSQRLTVLEVSVQRRARTPCGPGDLVHPHRTGIVQCEELFCGVENPVGGHLGATRREPVMAPH
jgi:hypothetical protein